MSAEDFIDTNVFVYLFDETDAIKRERADSLIYRSLENRSGCISYQVIQETMNVITGKLGIHPERVRLLLDDILIPLWQINPTPGLYRQGIRLQAGYGFSFYDSLIVAAALEAGCSRLYTEDMQHGQQIHSLTIHNPFLQWPQDGGDGITWV